MTAAPRRGVGRVCLRARARLAYAGSRRSRIARRVCPLAAVNATLERATRTCVVGMPAFDDVRVRSAGEARGRARLRACGEARCRVSLTYRAFPEK